MNPLKPTHSISALCQFATLNLFTTMVFFLLKFRHLRRVGISEKALAYIWQDIIFFGLLSLLVLFFIKKLKPLLFFAFSLSLFNILFTAKMGYPITQSLFSQTGDFLMVQTSIHSPSVIKSLMAFFLLLLAFLFLLFGWMLNFGKKMSLTLTLLLAVIFSISTIQNFQMHESKDKHLGYSFFYSLSFKPNSLKSMIEKLKDKLDEPVFTSWSLHENQKETLQKPKNIVVVVVETLSELDLRDKMNEVMPHLAELKKEGFFFERHYTPWPFSSKSLYSIICGRYPHASNLIEMRLIARKSCGSWVEKLARDHNYQSFVAYTGDFQYDNMGPFFKAQGFHSINDRNTLNKEKKYQETPLSLDDQSMVDAFKKWQHGLTEPFIATFITMNSHFPFWDPKEKKKFKDDFFNAIHYQDQIIHNISSYLKDNDLWDDTLLVVTGDHGRQVVTDTASLFPERAFKVPLLIAGGQIKAQTIDHPTVHNFIGSSLVQLATGLSFGYQNQNLFSREPAFLYADSEQLKIARLSPQDFQFMNSDLSYYFRSPNWNDKGTQCTSECEKILGPFYNFFENNTKIYDF